jgi:hypothetical protein
MTTKLEDVLGDLQDELATFLLKKIRAGEAKAADLNVARQLLKDNAISLNEVTEDTPEYQLAKSLPFDAETA